MAPSSFCMQYKGYCDMTEKYKYNMHVSIRTGYHNQLHMHSSLGCILTILPRELIKYRNASTAVDRGKPEKSTIL